MKCLLPVVEAAVPRLILLIAMRAVEIGASPKDYPRIGSLHQSFRSASLRRCRKRLATYPKHSQTSDRNRARPADRTAYTQC